MKLRWCRGSVQRVTQIIVDQEPVKDVTNFTFLDSIIATEARSEIDINLRSNHAATVLRGLNNVLVSNCTKIQLHQRIVLSTAVYTWKVAARAFDGMNAFHECCLCRILKITNPKFLKRISVACWRFGPKEEWDLQVIFFNREKESTRQLYNGTNRKMKKLRETQEDMACYCSKIQEAT